MSVSSFVCFFWREDFISNHPLLVMATRSSPIACQKLPDFGKLYNLFSHFAILHHTRGWIVIKLLYCYIFQFSMVKRHQFRPAEIKINNLRSRLWLTKFSWLCDIMQEGNKILYEFDICPVIFLLDLWSETDWSTRLSRRWSCDLVHGN